MSEIPFIEFLRDYWAIAAGFVGIVFGYGIQSQKVAAQSVRIDKIESHLYSTLRDLKDDVKDISKKVDSQQSATHQMHVDVLEKLNKMRD